MRKLIIGAFIALILAISCNGQEVKAGAMVTPQIKFKFQKYEKPELEMPVFLAVQLSFADEKLAVTPILNPLGGSVGSFFEFKILRKQEFSAYALFLKDFKKEEDKSSTYLGVGLSKSLIKDFVYPFIEIGSPVSKLHPEFFIGVTLQYFKKFGKKKEHH